MNWTLFWQTCRFQRIRLALVCVALAVWGFLLPVIYARFGSQFSALMKSGLLPKEFALLEFLMRHRDQLFTAEAILDRVWKSESDASSETLRTTIKRMRQKLDVDGQPSIITTVKGLGYKVEAE